MPMLMARLRRPALGFGSPFARDSAEAEGVRGIAMASTLAHGWSSRPLSTRALEASVLRSGHSRGWRRGVGHARVHPQAGAAGGVLRGPPGARRDHSGRVL